MTVRESEEKCNSSNTKISEIKNEESKKEEFINLLIDSSNSQNQIEKVPINKESNNVEEESQRSTKRSRITESTIKNEEQSESDSVTSGLGQDPLLVTERILSQYYDFMDYIYRILKNDEQKQDIKLQWQKWNEILDRGKNLVKTVNRNLRIVKLDMECLESLEDFEKQFRFRKAHIPNILTLLRGINSGITSSMNFRLVSDIKYRGKVLPMCLRELEVWKNQLGEMIGVIKVLKELDLKSDDDGDEEEEEKSK